MTNLLLNAHALRYSLTFRTLQTELSGHVDLLGDNDTFGERMTAYKQPAGKKIIADILSASCPLF